ncbi:MAG: DEAD/DEAH box helicase, partial [Gemmatimonadaceae bacterium]
MTARAGLPVEEALSALRLALTHRNCVVLEAPPGAGKTTRVPPALLNETWLANQRIVMLEPRRLAARSAAHYMARQLNETVGHTIGFRVRGETRVGARTRVEVVTEGILARLLSADAALDGIGLVIFDEFHERSLHADLGLALTLQTQQLLRPDLRLLVMSATIDGDAVADLLHDDEGVAAPVVRSAGRMFPVGTEYRPARTDERIESAVTRTVLEAVQQHEGDLLVFLPGAGEQRRVAERLFGNTVLQQARARV